jgi:hypothetical protein
MRRKRHSERTKRKISEALKKRSIGNHVVKGAKINSAIQGVAGTALGALTYAPLGPVGAVAGGVFTGGLSAVSGGVTGAGYGAATYGVRKRLDTMRGLKEYKYDYSRRIVPGSFICF